MPDPEFLRDSFDGDTPSLVEVVEMAIRQQMASAYAVLPCAVVAYDAATQRATVQPAAQAVGTDGTPRKLPPIQGVPVIFPAGSAWSLTFDIIAGDTGLLLVSSVDAGNWKENGNQAAKPSSARRGNLADGFFLPGARPKSAALPDPAGLSLGADGARIHIASNGTITADGTEIKLGAGATDYAALASLIDGHFTALQTWLDTHTHTSAAPASPTSPPILPSTTPPVTVGASKVKAE